MLALTLLVHLTVHQYQIIIVIVNLFLVVGCFLHMTSVVNVYYLHQILGIQLVLTVVVF